MQRVWSVRFVFVRFITMFVGMFDLEIQNV